MSTPYRWGLRPACAFAAAMLVVAHVLLTEPATPAAEPAPLAEKAHVSSTAGGVADIVFSTAKRYAVVFDSVHHVQRLYTEGEVVFRPRHPGSSARVLEVGARGVIILLRPQGETRYVTAGALLPGSPVFTLVGIVTLDRLRYRFKVVDQVVDPEPVVVSLDGSQALLEKQVLRIPAHAEGRQEPKQREFTAGLFRKVTVTEVDPRTYELDKEALLPLLEDVADVVSGLRLKPDPMYFGLTSGLSLNVQSPFGDGVLDSTGFRVERSPMAESFGLQPGDIVVSLNGRPVNSPLNAYMMFQELFIKNRDLTHLRVVLLRDGALTTQSYRIR